MRWKAGAGLGILLVALCAAAPLRAEGLHPGERDLLQRLFSPCCYRETLDVHPSPIADELRIEIHQRLGEGEPPDSIVADMVSRYGAAVVTKPPRTVTAIALFSGAALFVSVCIGFALRRPRGGAPVPVVPRGRGPATDADRQLEDRLADELSALE